MSSTTTKPARIANRTASLIANTINLKGEQVPGLALIIESAIEESGAPELLAAAQLQILNFQRQNIAKEFLGDDDHEAWNALSNAVKKATSVP